MPLFILFVAVPIIEIALFIQVGGWIGLWSTLAIVIGTAIAGTYLLRQQGRAALSDLQRSFSQLSDPSRPLADGAMILFAGALLLTPGFFTDALGLSLMIPGVRGAIFRWVRSRVSVASFQMGTGQSHTAPQPDSTVIDADYEEISPKHDPSKPSGWTQH